MRLILILILLLQALTTYFTWASYALDKEFTDNLNTSEQQEEKVNEILV